MRPVWYLDSLDIYAPYNPPNTAFSTKNHPGNLCKKTSPVPPKGGDGGTVLALLTARKNAAIIRGKRRPHGPPPSEPPRATTAQATRKGR